ncbi:MAG: NUDIX hydrolase [Pseudomonadota bacterium]
MIRRYGEAVQPDKSYRVRPGAYAVLVRDGRVLLTFQSEPLPEFQLPGGGIDPGEHPIPALHREVMEETGWTISPPRRLGTFRRFTYMPEYAFWAEKICHIFLARPVLRRSSPIEAAHTAIWKRPDEAILSLANEGDRAFLSAYFDPC